MVNEEITSVNQWSMDRRANPKWCAEGVFVTLWPWRIGPNPAIKPDLASFSPCGGLVVLMCGTAAIGYRFTERKTHCMMSPVQFAL